MARVGDEAPLSLEAVLESREHRVQRLAEPRDLVVGRRHGKALVERSRRDVGRAAPHRLDRPERRAGEEIAAERGEDEGDRPADQEGGAEAAQSLRSILARRADDQDDVLPAPHRWEREQPCRLVQPRHRRTVREDGPTLRGVELGLA